MVDGGQNLKELTRCMKSYGNRLIRQKIIHVDWDAFNVFRKGLDVNWNFMHPIPDYLDMQSFLQLRAVCRQSTNLGRPLCLVELPMAYTFTHIKKFIGRVKKVDVVRIVY